MPFFFKQRGEFARRRPGERWRAEPTMITLDCAEAGGFPRAASCFHSRDRGTVSAVGWLIRCASGDGPRDRSGVSHVGQITER